MSHFPQSCLDSEAPVLLWSKLLKKWKVRSVIDRYQCGGISNAGANRPDGSLAVQWCGQCRVSGVDLLVVEGVFVVLADKVFYQRRLHGLVVHSHEFWDVLPVGRRDFWLTGS